MNLSGINCVFIQEEITVWSSTNDQIFCWYNMWHLPRTISCAYRSCTNPVRNLWERGGKWWSVGARNSFLQRAEKNWNATNTFLSHCISTCGWNKPLSVIPWWVWCRLVMRLKWWTKMWRWRDIELALAPNFTEPNRTGPPNTDAFSMRSVGFRHDASTCRYAWTHRDGTQHIAWKTRPCGRRSKTTNTRNVHVTNHALYNPVPGR